MILDTGFHSGQTSSGCRAITLKQKIERGNDSKKSRHALQAGREACSRGAAARRPGTRRIDLDRDAPENG
jgi:hypothetical protein